MPPSFVYGRIFPPIGIARLGNSDSESFVGPDSPGIVPDPSGGYKDEESRIKRQAARFRVYGFDSAGMPTELTLDHPSIAAIIWTVQLANKKAEWYRFGGAQRVADILDGKISGQAERRNSKVSGKDRDGLQIVAPATSVCGRKQVGTALSGIFRLPLDPANPPSAPREVYLGELRTDEAGRLLVLGGRGESGTLFDKDDRALVS